MIDLNETIGNSEKLQKLLKKSKIKRYKYLEKNANYLENSKLLRHEALNNPYPINEMEKSKNKFPFLCSLMRLRTALSGIKIIEINPYKKGSNKPVIFVPTHIGKFDIEVVYECIKEHALLLSGTEDRMHGTLNGYFLEKNGVNYVDRSDKQDRQNSVKKMRRDLENGYNLLWFIEGTWNLSSNQLIYDLSYSIISLALEYDVEIVPIGLNQVDKKMFVNFGKPFKPNLNSELVDSISELRNILATLKWELFEYCEMYSQIGITPEEYNEVKDNENRDYYCTSRDMIGDDYWANYLYDRIKEWPITDLDEECKYVFKPKNDSYVFFEEFNSSVVEDKEGNKKVKRI